MIDVAKPPELSVIQEQLQLAAVTVRGWHDDFIHTHGLSPDNQPEYLTVHSLTPGQNLRDKVDFYDISYDPNTELGGRLGNKVHLTASYRMNNPQYRFGDHELQPDRVALYYRPVRNFTTEGLMAVAWAWVDEKPVLLPNSDMTARKGQGLEFTPDGQIKSLYQNYSGQIWNMDTQLLFEVPPYKIKKDRSGRENRTKIDSWHQALRLFFNYDQSGTLESWQAWLGFADSYIGDYLGNPQYNPRGGATYLDGVPVPSRTEARITRMTPKRLAIDNITTYYGQKKSIVGIEDQKEPALTETLERFNGEMGYDPKTGRAYYKNYDDIYFMPSVFDPTSHIADFEGVQLWKPLIADKHPEGMTPVEESRPVFISQEILRAIKTIDI